MNSKSRQMIAALVLASTVLLPIASHARGASDNSVLASMLAASVVGGSIAAIGDGSQLVVESVENAGQSVVIVFKRLSDGVTVSVRTAASAAGNVSLAAGKVVTVVADASGHALMYSGQMIAYVPNAVGLSLIHSKKSVDREHAE